MLNPTGGTNVAEKKHNRSDAPKKELKMINVSVVTVEPVIPDLPKPRLVSTYPDGTLLKCVELSNFFVLRVGEKHAFDFDTNRTYQVSFFTRLYSPVDSAELVIKEQR